MIGAIGDATQKRNASHTANPSPPSEEPQHARDTDAA